MHAGVIRSGEIIPDANSSTADGPIGQNPGNGGCGFESRLASLFKRTGRGFTNGGGCSSVMSNLRQLQFLGGPWDGARVLVHDDQQTAAITDGARVHVYERGELFEGPKVRQVMRHVNVVPLPRREGEK